MYNADIDECLSCDDNCSDNANCTNTDGGYNCSCHIGYTGDGFNCTSILMLIGNVISEEKLCVNKMPDIVQLA